MAANGYRILYSAQDAGGTVQLWTTDGAIAEELTAIDNDWGGLYPSQITAFTNNAVFAGIDASGRNSLWFTDGTAAGTAEIEPDGAFTNGLDPKGLIALGEKILFAGTDSTGHTGIWATDGTAAGTIELLRLADLGATIATPETVLAGGTAFFAIGGHLVVSDGTAPGTAILADGLIAQEVAPAAPILAAVDGKLFFAANGQFWRSDGTAAGTTRRTAIAGPHTRLDPSDITAYGTQALFRGTDALGVPQLWITDTSPAGAHALTRFHAGVGASLPFAITTLGSSAIFFANAGTPGTRDFGVQLWLTDGTPAGTRSLTAVRDNTGTGLTPSHITVIGGLAVFTSDLGGLWATDGTSAGTLQINGPGFIGSVATGDGRAIFSTGGATGTLFITDGSFGGTQLLIQAAYANDLTLLQPQGEGPSGGAPPCFLPGTRIATERGDIAVEHLRPGDRVRTRNGGWQALAWIGQGHAVVGPAPDSPARPILIRADALAPGIPARDLRVTQGHCLLLADPDDLTHHVLVPAALLVNGVSILLDPVTGPVDYFHLAITGHDAVFAEGAACETWRDDGSALHFGNPPPPGLATGPACAPKLAYGPRATAIWQSLRARAGCAYPPGDGDPALHLRADGVAVTPDFRHGDTFRFTLNRRPRLLAIASRAAIPAIAGLTPDIRRLGVGIARIIVAQAGRRTDLPFTDPALLDGFHPIDPGEGRRWTNGHGLIAAAPLGLARGKLRIEIDAIGLPGYPR